VPLAFTPVVGVQLKVEVVALGVCAEKASVAVLTGEKTGALLVSVLVSTVVDFTWQFR
jgi:hypothetical protein